MRAFVQNMRGKALMPCSCRKAKALLKEKKAKIVGYKPFTIKLTIATGEAIQPVDIGVDEGAKHIGIAVASGTKVFAKGEIELRQDIKSLLDARRTLRRSRRNRKTRHRKARWQNRRKSMDWLPPSLQSRINATFHWIDKFCSLVPNPKLHIEVGKFDAVKMINPEISGVDYQHGQTYGYYDVRYFVFARDNYTCQACHKSNGKILHTHHLLYKSKGGTDRADNLITICSECHTSKAHKPGGILYKWMLEHKKAKQYKEPPFMNALRRRTFRKYPDVDITYGSETTPHRKELGLEKTHYNDAIAISKIENVKSNLPEWFYFKQFRKKKRSLHESIPRKGRKLPNVRQKRNAKNTKFSSGLYLNDKVAFRGQKGWVSSFTGSSVRIWDIDGNYVSMQEKSYTQVPASKVRKLSHNNGWQCCIR